MCGVLKAVVEVSRDGLVSYLFQIKCTSLLSAKEIKGRGIISIDRVNKFLFMIWISDPS